MRECHSTFANQYDLRFWTQKALSLRFTNCVGNSCYIRINGCLHKAGEAYLRNLYAKLVGRNAHLNRLLMHMRVRSRIVDMGQQADGKILPLSLLKSTGAHKYIIQLIHTQWVYYRLLIVGAFKP